MARLIGINHVAVEVGSVDEALEFYGRIFDLTLRGRSARMAFIDMGDQFLALSTGRTQPPDAERHIGLVVDNRGAALEAARAAGAEMFGDNDFRDPWGNHFQVVAYRDIQFTKTDRILAGLAPTRTDCVQVGRFRITLSRWGVNRPGVRRHATRRCTIVI